MSFTRSIYTPKFFSKRCITLFEIKKSEQFFTLSLKDGQIVLKIRKSNNKIYPNSNHFYKRTNIT